MAPMKATAGDLPFGDGWSYEVKWDGMRALAFVRDGQLRIGSANERDVTVSWPELAGLPAALPAATALLDGELVATDELGRPSFGRLQQRMHVAVAAEAARRAAEVPVTYVVFDLLHLDGHSLLDVPPPIGAGSSTRSSSPGRGGGPRPSTTTAPPSSPPPTTRASRASSPSGSTRATSRAPASAPGARSRSAATRRSWWAGGSPARAPDRDGSARC